MNHNKFIIGAFIIYIFVMTGVMISQGIGIAPDRYAFLLLLVALLVRRTRQFLIDWIPFLLILIAYDYLRGLADNAASRVHITELINLEKTLFFGNMPPALLQKHFFDPNNLKFYDYIATILYFLHFAIPEAFAFILWLKNRHQFRQFVTALLLMSFAAFFTYLVYPAAPPWIAARDGYLEGVTKIMDVTVRSFPTSIDLPTIYHRLNPNPVAAIPSMHAAYPFLILLFGLYYFKKKALWFLIYVISLWISIVYLGEHYVIDAILGAIYAVIFFYVAKLMPFHVQSDPGENINGKKIKQSKHRS